MGVLTDGTYIRNVLSLDWVMFITRIYNQISGGGWLIYGYKSWRRLILLDLKWVDLLVSCLRSS